MRRRIIEYMFLLALFAVLVLAVFAIPRIYAACEAQAYGALKSTAMAISVSQESRVDEHAFSAVYAAIRPIRITWIAPNGGILYDSHADPSTMENHANRAEIIQAIQNGEGRDSRLSETLNRKTYYYALRLLDGSVLRLSESHTTVLGVLLQSIPALLFAFLLVMVFVVFAAGKLTTLLMRPIDAIDLDHPAENNVYEELTPLLARLQAQSERIKQQIHTMEAHSVAFDTITENMVEGLVVLAGDGRVLSVNRTAARLFSVTADVAVNTHYMALTRDLRVHEAVELTLSGHTSEAKLLSGGRFYQLLANPVRSDGAPKGAILLFLDNTEREQAEEARREFSANVSHEIKTPLTSIAGYAEMLAAGMVKPEDTTETAEKIHAEALRMIALIEDIIELSKLDEGKAPAQKEPVELLSLSRDAMATLTAFAKAKEVSVTVEGEEATVSGVRSVLSEMLINLLENSIKYNQPCGKVHVNVTRTNESVAVMITDTGVGIAPEHQERVFERFYRVDKSHNRNTGGTGLGLSIVKHGAMLHGAKVTLKSKVGEGTEVKIIFFCRKPPAARFAGRDASLPQPVTLSQVQLNTARKT